MSARKNGAIRERGWEMRILISFQHVISIRNIEGIRYDCSSLFAPQSLQSTRLASAFFA